MTIHTGEKPHRCEVCDGSFSLKGGLTKHELIHNGDKPHRCELCGRSFSLTISVSTLAINICIVPFDINHLEAISQGISISTLKINRIVVKFVVDRFL